MPTFELLNSKLHIQEKIIRRCDDIKEGYQDMLETESGKILVVKVDGNKSYPFYEADFFYMNDNGEIGKQVDCILW